MIPPSHLLRRPKSLGQHLYDLLGAPLRLLVFPDAWSEKFYWTSLRAERLSVVLPHLRGRLLDIGAGDNALVSLYGLQQGTAGVSENVGIDIAPTGHNVQVISSCKELPFPDHSFDTVSFVACLNHIPERMEALRETRRVLRPGGRLLMTMIGHWIGTIGHAVWWYSEEKRRHTHAGERMGLDETEIRSLLKETGFKLESVHSFVYGLNRLYISRPAEGVPLVH